MLHTSRIARLLVCIAGFLLPLPLQAAVKTMMLTEALKKQQVSVQTRSCQGRLYDNNLELTVQNRSGHDLTVIVDPAMIFRPSDTSYQDLVITGGEQIVLKPKEQQALVMNAFCGKSYARCPRFDLKYRFFKQGSAAMAGAARLIRQYKLFNYVGQSAIWSFTNNHSLSGIYSYDNPGPALLLAKYISEHTGKPMPAFHTAHKINRNGNGPAFDARVSMFYADLKWDETAARNTHIVVLRSDGSIYRRSGEEHISGTRHSLKMRFDPSRELHDIYTVRVVDDNNRVYAESRVDMRDTPL